MVRTDIEQELRRNGYFDAHADVSHDAPRKVGDQYLVNLIVSIAPGSQYHIAQIIGDGGPLLHGREISTTFRVKPGDAATDTPWGDLAGQLRGVYLRNGYADVSVDGPPILDREHALVSYHLTVAPGPLYHLRSLTIHNLNAGQESKVRRLLGLAPRDPFNALAISALSDKVRNDSSLSGYRFTFSPQEVKADAVVDLTLDFFNETDKPSVIVQ